jgi:hypothetical protein
MNVRKIIQKRLRGAAGGTRFESDVNATIAANVGERGAVTRVSSTQRAQSTSESRRDDRDPRP